jgi:hypothetical protein
LAIIIDTLEEDISDFVLSDDGTGAGIRIPAMLISKKDGDALVNYLLGTNDPETALTAEFLMDVHDDNSVDATLWYSSSDDRSLDFVKNVAEFIEPIIKTVNFMPKFVTWSCPHCDSDSKRTNCVSDGKYCAMQHDANIDIDGVEVVMENLRQHCIYELGNNSTLGHKSLFYQATQKSPKDMYFEYVSRAHEVCGTRLTGECSKLVAANLGID